MQNNYKRLILLPQKDKSVLRKHPWIFSGALQKTSIQLEEGEIVEVFSSKSEFSCVGFWQDASIAVKVLSFEKEKIDYNFILERVQQAVRYRKSLGFFNNPNSNIFRLINAEGDFMPSLIADYYNGLVVLQFHSVGMLKLKNEIVEALKESLGEDCKAIFSKSSSTLPKHVADCDGFLYGELNPEWYAMENGLSFKIDYSQGQKTGFFIDQRVNRELVKTLSNQRNVLNAFSYTGGFSLAAIQGGANKVLSLDISKRAVELCEENVRKNFADNTTHQALAVDVLEYLDNVEKGEFDLIILDPPAFAKHNRNLNQALKGYRQINQKAMEKIAKGGFLFTFSCSQAVSREDFGTMLFSCAAITNRRIKIVQRLPHAMDHPQSIFHPEGEYLKGFLLQVE